MFIQEKEHNVMCAERNFRSMADDHLVQTSQSNPCRFAETEQIKRLAFRQTPYWHHLFTSRHLGIHRPDDTACNWTARVLTRDKLYKQRCLGPAIDIGRGRISYREALARAFEWFETADVKALANEPRALGKTTEVHYCPIGDAYTVGRALRDYSEWTRIARSPGGHYNNLVLINYHLIPNFADLLLEEFTAMHLRDLAVQVLETPPRFGFMARRDRQSVSTLTPDELRRRKRTFNSLVSILRTAFGHAWDNGHINSERPLRCLKRVSVPHEPRHIFLDRDECRSLLDQCTPALRDLVLASLYTGCRAGELGRLVVGDVGKQGFGIHIQAFKRSPARFVFVPDEGMAFFLTKCEGKTDNEQVFRSDMGKVWKKQHSSLFRRAVAKASLPRGLVFHSLRHTYASDLVKAGVTLEVIARQLGHANTITVMNTYGHLAEQVREAQIRERFSPLDHGQQAEAARRRDQLSALWSSLQRDDWRTYAVVPRGTHHPTKSFARPVVEVLEAFQRYETNFDPT